MSQQPSGLDLSLERVVDAPRARVFALLTEPDGLRRWWGPHGFSTPEIDLDLTVGGRYRFTMEPPEGDRFHLAGVFLEVDPPQRLVYTFAWEEPTADDRETVVALTLAASGAPEERTLVSLSQGSFATEERLGLHRDGWTDSFDRLREVVALT